MTTVELRKQLNRERYKIDISQYNDDEAVVIDWVLKVAENTEMLTAILLT